MEPEIPETNFKSMAVVLWIALITAILVTIIDWKIKSDILRLTDAFYRVYPAKLEEQHEGPQIAGNFTHSSGHNNTSSVLHLSMVDSDAGMEAEGPPVSLRKNVEDHSQDWAKFAPEVETGIES